jgi:CRP-like cAMP-binding protein
MRPASVNDVTTKAAMFILSDANLAADAASGQPQALPATRGSAYEQGDAIFAAGTMGTAWRVLSGSVRLNRIEADGAPMFASLAVAGDVIGAETLLFGVYTFEAVALSPCRLAPWPGAETSPARESLLLTLAQAERRAADVIALRGGQAIDRVKRLVRLLARDADGGAPACRIALPGLKDMAEITALTVETVSRSISGLRRAGLLSPQGERRGCRPARLCVVDAALA